MPFVPARFAGAVAALCFAAGLAAAAWSSLGAMPAVTQAGLFGSPVVDLRLERDGGIHSFLGGDNLAPGDRLAGTLRLNTAAPLPAGVFDLDVDLRGSERGPPGRQRYDEALVAHRLAYGSDDLLKDPGRNLTREIDGNRLLGNGDGRLTVREFAAGANDLPAPASTGSSFVVELRFAPERGGSASWQGRTLDLTFVFRLADRADADLN